MTEMKNRVLSPAEVRTMLRDGAEIALLDVREEGVFSEDGHPFFANSVPLSRLELMIRDLVPRQGTRVVVLDGGDEGLAERAAAKLDRMGYDNVAVMAGGSRAWAEAGFELFTGVNVPSKAFGELVEHRSGTPHIAAAELKRRLDAGEEILIVDSRPIGEFRNMSIPGAFDCPGAELVYRVPDRLRSPDSLVVVNCAGRTRSIIGAQSLRNAGIANPVMALENGTMGWELAGLELARGREDALPPPSPEGLAKARALADKVAERFGIKRIDDAALARFEGEADRRTLYVFDVRSPEEYEAGHLAVARSAPGGQLVQATDVYMATRNARIVLVDDDGVRAVMTGSWLVQMGWPEVYVLDGGLAGRALVAGPRVPCDPRTRQGRCPDDRGGRAEAAARCGRGGGRRSRAEHRLRGWPYPRRLVRGAGTAAGQSREIAAPSGAGADLAGRGAREASGGRTWGLRFSGRVCARRRHGFVARCRAAAGDRARGDGRHTRRLLAPSLRSLCTRGRARTLPEMGNRAGPPDRARGRCRLPGAGSGGLTASPPDEREQLFFRS